MTELYWIIVLFLQLGYVYLYIYMCIYKQIKEHKSMFSYYFIEPACVTLVYLYLYSASYVVIIQLILNELLSNEWQYDE